MWRPNRIATPLHDGGASHSGRGAGKELYHLTPDGALRAVTIQSPQAFGAVTPTKPFDARKWPPETPVPTTSRGDGQTFLMIKATGGDPTATPTGIVVVLNWVEELEARSRRSERRAPGVVVNVADG